MAAIELIARGIAWESEERRRILVCEPTRGGYAYLPGGHVEFGESAGTALRREMIEETGIEVEVGSFIGVCESGFIQDGRSRHEVNLLFHMKHDWPGAVTSKEAAIRFRWLGVDELDRVRLLPVSIATWIRRLAEEDQRDPCPLLLTEMAA